MLELGNRARQMADRRLRRAIGDRGAAMVEFALTFLLLATIVFGAIDLGRAFFTWNQVKNAAREGAVYAERDPWSQAPSGSSCPNPANIRYRAQHENGSARPELAVSTRAQQHNLQQAAGLPPLPDRSRGHDRRPVRQPVRSPSADSAAVDLRSLP